MSPITSLLSFAAAFSLAMVSHLEANDRPLLTIELESYEALLTDASLVAEAVGSDASIIEMQLGGMLGPSLIGLIDPSQPWHAALWMEAMDQPPLIAIVLPVADAEAFGTAMQTSMLGMLGVQMLDVGDRVVLYGSSPGLPISDGSIEQIQGYAAALVMEPSQTLTIKVALTGPMREAAVGALELPKAQMMAAFDDPSVAASGMPPEALAGIMDGYFSMYQALVRDLDSLEYGISVSATDLVYELSLTPLENSESAKFLASQNIDITDLATSALWDSDVAVVMGMAPFPEGWQPELQKLMEALMPLYGLGEDAAADWMDAMNMTFPCKALYNMNFNPEVSYSGFYELLKTPAAEVYEKWLSISESSFAAEGSAPSYYSDLSIEKGYRTQGGNSIDLMQLTVNSGHPIMQLPEQQAIMEQMFKDGKITYEMCLAGNRIYMATEGALDAVMAQSNNTPPMEINANTRLVGSMDLISMMKMGSKLEGAAAHVDLSDVDSEGTQFLFSVETSDRLTMKGVTPLKLVKVFSELQ